MKLCPKCGSVRFVKAGVRRNKKGMVQRWRCWDCETFNHTQLLKFDRKVSYEQRMKQRYFEKGIFKIGYVDIETDGQLKGDYGTVISAVILIRDLKTGKNERYDLCVTRKEILRNLNFDKRVLKELFKLMSQCDLLVGHYFHGWKKFDMPFLRVRAAQLGINDFVYGSMKYGDTWNMAHSVLNIQSYSLDNVARALKIKDIKTRFDAYTWKMSRRGNVKALDKVLDHNIKDVILTYQVHKKLEVKVPIPSHYV